MSDHEARTWETLARRDPYWAVVSEERFRRADLDEDARERFFETGAAHVEGVLRAVRERIDPAFEPGDVLDFGCGVGRLLVPFAAVAKSVLGVDVSAAMLDEARRTVERHQLDNVRLEKVQGAVLPAPGVFDLVHTYIVLQHVRPALGMQIVRALVSAVRPGGVGVIHVTYAARSGSRLADALRRVAKRVVGSLSPRMQMHPYDLNAVFRALQEAGASGVRAELTDHGYLGVTLMFQMPQRAE